MNPTVVIGILIGVAAVVFAAAITVWAIKITRRGMHSPARSGATALPKTELKSNLLRLNHPQHPFQVFASSDADLEIEWSVTDAKWIEMLGPASSKVAYRAWILLDEAQRTVRYREQLRESAVTAGGGGAFAESHVSSGLEMWGRRTSHRWGLRPDFSVGEVLRYDFTPADVKDLVRQIANDSGWDFELVFLKGRARSA